MVPAQVEDQDRLRGRITEIPKIPETYIDEVEIAPVLDPYSYVRIKFDNIASEYIYEVIEPALSEDEGILLEMLKSSVVLTINKLDEASDREKESVLREVTDELLKTMEVSLNMDSRRGYTTTSAGTSSVTGRSTS
jgi:flagellar protein FlaI